MRPLGTSAFAVLGVLASAASCMLVAPLEPPLETQSAGGGSLNAGMGGAFAGMNVTVNGGEGGVPSSNAGAGGQAGSPESCSTNLECSQAGFGEPFRCRADGSCVKLATPECPLVYGDADNPHAVFIGAYAGDEQGSLANTTEVFTYRLALDEFNGEGVQGLPPASPGGAQRPLVTIVCDNDPAYLDASMEHLANQVQVPAILAALDTGPLLHAFRGYGRDRVLFVSPFGGSRDLNAEQDQGLIWSMLGTPSDFAPIYAALLARAETFLNARYPLQALRVATVETNDAFSNELAQAVLAEMRFNDADVAANSEAGNYLGRVIKLEQFQTDVESTIQDIREFRPHVIVSLANELFVSSGGVLQEVELLWGTLAAPIPPRPFYLLSPKNFDRLGETVGPVIEEQIRHLDELAYQRFLTIGAAPAEDRSLYDEFRLRLARTFPNARLEAENLYDAFYFLVYALHGAGSVAELTGPGAARGMLRLVNGPNNAFDVGPDSISETFNALSRTGNNIWLMGTLGPPEFTGQGARIESGSVSCFDSNAQPRNHVLRYDRDSESLVGDFSRCYSGF